jgi:predicted pyridoxine 5'-phosphate oxidase superfamily flavin-nucleotide-binding protein
MGKLYSEITSELADWIARQHVFFVATAPLSGEGHINCSPKGLDTLRVLDPLTVAYVDLTGSGAETVAHVQENGRIVLMFCAFEGPPKIVRVHGKADVVVPSSPSWAELAAQLPMQPSARAIMRVHVARVSDSCGYAVPAMDFVADRDVLDRWVQRKGVHNLPQYRREHNAHSIDGLPTAAFDTDS